MGCQPLQADLDYYEENCEDSSSSSDSSDSLDSVECASHDDCGGDTPFCYNGLCDKCDQCQNCWDGVDGTCGPCGATTSGDTCGDTDCDACVAEFMQADGCECWEDDSCDQDNLIPDGCNSCGEQAAASCGITEDDDDHCA